MKSFLFILAGVILGNIEGGISLSLETPEWNSSCLVRTDSTILWAVGESGQVANYVVGNDSVPILIEALSLGEQYRLNDVFFWDGNRGWIVGYVDDGSADQNRGMLWRTTNGGQNWDSIPDSQLPPVFSIQPMPFIYIEFKTPEIGFVYCEEGYYLKTTDGGFTWYLSRKSHPDILPGTGS